MIYLDYAATTPVRVEVSQAHDKLLRTIYGNPDSLHEVGKQASELMEESRARIAQLLHVSKDEIFFTSGGSEANNMAIKGYVFANPQRGKHIITSSIEHSSVKNAIKQLEEVFGYEVTTLPVDTQGLVQLVDLKEALRDDTVLVSIMMVNNEVGSIQPIEAIGVYIHENSHAKLHVDMVQALGKFKLPLHNVDMASFSAHKIHGLKGSGFLFKQKNITLLPLISGGQQESGLRAGTSNVVADVVLSKTLRLTLDEMSATDKHVRALSSYAREQLSSISGICINSPEGASPYILNLSVKALGSEVLLNALNQKGIMISAVSTCSTKSKAESKVIKAMGLEDWRASHMIRISFAKETTIEELDTFIDALKEVMIQYDPNK